MYKLIYVFLISFLTACQTSSVQQQTLVYPDIKGFFKTEIARLNKQKPFIKKTIHLNKENETKSISNIQWEEELSLFLESDINKPAFKGLYLLKKDGQEEIYTAQNVKMRTREIKILRNPKNTIQRISITNHTENTLYTTDEYLEYCPDSVYQIVKRQEVLLMGTNNYWILGKFKK